MGRLLAVHLLNVSEDHDVDRGDVSSETKYFVLAGLQRTTREGPAFQITHLVTHKNTGNLAVQYSAFTTDK